MTRLAPSLWSGGVQWGPASSDERKAYWGPVTVAETMPSLYVAINGVLQPSVKQGGWRMGRDGWFSDLAPCSATLAFTDAVTGDIGDEVIISTETGLLWKGRLEAIANVKNRDTGAYEGSVTAGDGLARLGLSTADGFPSFGGFTLDTLLPIVCRELGVDPITIVVGDSATALPSLDGVDTSGKTVLDYIQLAERTSNALLALQPDGTLLALTRDTITDPSSVTNGEFEVDTTGWVTFSGASVARSTSEWYAGAACMRITSSATAFSGARFLMAGTFEAGRTYRLALAADLISGTADWEIGFLDGTTAFTSDTTITATGSFAEYSFYVTLTADQSDLRVFIRHVDASVAVLAVDSVTVRPVVDLLDLVGHNSPSRWSVETQKSSVINRWTFTDTSDVVRLDEVDADSVALYGENAYTIDDYLSTSVAHWPSAMRAAVATPRPIASGEFPITSTDQEVLHLRPLEWVSFDGDTWQIMSVEHQVTPSEWRISVTADVSQNYLAGAAEPDTSDPDTSPATLHTQTLTSTKSATAFKSSGGAAYGNGAGDYLPVGFYANTRTRAFIDFTSLSWPSGFIRVRKATLNLRTSGQAWVAFGSKPKLYARRITDSWSEGTYNAATPNQYSASNALVWPGPGTTKSGQTLKSIGTSENNDISIDVTDILQDAHDAGTFLGIALISANEDSKGNTIEFYSDDHATSGFRPELVLVCEVS